MKKKFIIYFLLAAMITSLLLTSCAKKEFDYYKEDLSKYVTLGQYKGISVDVENVKEVTDDDVKEQVDAFLESLGEKIEVTDRAAVDGDTVNIDYVGKLDDEEFDGGSDEDYDLVIGSEKLFTAEFEEGIIGKVPSETPFDLTLTFPSDFSANPALAGKTVVFTITLNHIKDIKLPEYTDELIDEKTEHNTIEEYEKAIKDDLIAKREAKLTQNKLNAVWQKIVENATVSSIPQKRIDEYVDGVIDYYKEWAVYYDVDYSEFVKTYLQTNETDLLARTTEEAKEAIAEELVFYAIVKTENYSVTDEEYSEGLKNYVVQYNFESEEEFEERYGKETIRDALLWDKVLNLLADGADINWVDPVEEEETDND
ncbi:MAG: trigger factor [Clostridiales bacterium]|nr:trigger factor [Clostridiales bacterium]